MRSGGFHSHGPTLRLQHVKLAGQFDGARPGNTIPITGQDLRAALDAVLRGEKPSRDQKASIGCNIKWR